MSWQKACLLSKNTVYDAISILNEVEYRVVLVLNTNKQLVGTITDGDVRRGILNGIDLHCSVEKIMNSQPIVGLVTEDKDRLLIKMKTKSLRQIPIVNENYQVVNIETVEHITEIHNSETPVVILAGGLGTRLSPLTQDMPKPMLDVAGKPMLERVLLSLITYGFYKFYLIVNYKKEIIKKYFSDGSQLSAEIEYVDEEKRLGTAGGLYHLEKKIDSNFIVHNADLITDLNYDFLLDFHQKQQALATIAVKKQEYKIPYGVIELDSGEIVSLQEKPTRHYFATAGIYAFSPEIFKYIQHDIYQDMPSLLLSLLQQKRKMVSFPIHEFWSDIGQHSEYQNIQERFKVTEI